MQPGAGGPGTGPTPLGCTSAFDLPDHLTPKADPALIAADEQHFAAVAESVERSTADLSDQLDAAREFVDKHGSRSSLDISPSWRLLVSPTKGTFVRQAGGEGAALAPTSTIGVVRSTRDETAVLAPHGGTIVEWLVEDGDLVSPGQPLVRLHPEAVPA